MTKNALIICNFRLRNIDEFKVITENLKKEKYEIFDIGDIDKESISLEFILEYIKSIREQGYNNLIFISNIRDVLFCMYRIYNKAVENYIFFMDKTNYSLLKKSDNAKYYKDIAEFKNVIENEIKSKIYININYNNYEQLFDFLFLDYKFKYFDIIENILLKSKESIEELEFYDLIEKNNYFYPFYSLFIIRNYSREDAMNLFLKLYDKYRYLESKEKVAERLVLTEGFYLLDFNEKIGLLSINMYLGIKNKELFEIPLFNILRSDEGKNAEKYYHIINNLNLYNSILENNIIKKEILKTADEYYLEKIEIPKSIRENKLMFLVDSLETKSYSGTKLLLDIILNILKQYPEYQIIVYSEENFFGVQHENPIIMDYNSRVMVFSDVEKQFAKQFENIKNVEFFYSDIYKNKEERVKDVFSILLKNRVKAVISTTIFSSSINSIGNYFPTIHLSLGGINYINNFDLYLYPHLESIKNNFNKELIPFDEKKMFSFDYTGEFIKSETIFERKKLGFNKEDFILITVGVRVSADIIKELAEIVIELIKDKKNVKWLIVGDDEIPVIDSYYSKYLNKDIFKIKYLGNLPEIYRMCDLYINPPRNGGGFSMAEAIINDLCVITPSVSPSGVLHCGLENSCKTLNEYKKELNKLYENDDYRKEKLKKEKIVQESLSYKKTIPKLIEYITMAEDIFVNKEK